MSKSCEPDSLKSLAAEQRYSFPCMAAFLTNQKWTKSGIGDQSCRYMPNFSHFVYRTFVGCKPGCESELLTVDIHLICTHWNGARTFISFQSCCYTLTAVEPDKSTA